MQFLETIVDPAVSALRNTPLDDEPETEDEKAVVTETRTWLRNNAAKGIPHAEAMRRLGVLTCPISTEGIARRIKQPEASRLNGAKSRGSVTPKAKPSSRHLSPPRSRAPARHRNRLRHDRKNGRGIARARRQRLESLRRKPPHHPVGQHLRTTPPRRPLMRCVEYFKNPAKRAKRPPRMMRQPNPGTSNKVTAQKRPPKKRVNRTRGRPDCPVFNTPGRPACVSGSHRFRTGNPQPAAARRTCRQTAAARQKPRLRHTRNTRRSRSARRRAARNRNQPSAAVPRYPI